MWLARATYYKAWHFDHGWIDGYAGYDYSQRLCSPPYDEIDDDLRDVPERDDDLRDVPEPDDDVPEPDDDLRDNPGYPWISDDDLGSESQSSD